jgi:hypothetical protein
MLRKKLFCKSETAFIMLNCIIQRQEGMIKGKKNVTKITIVPVNELLF